MPHQPNPVRASALPASLWETPPNGPGWARGCTHDLTDLLDAFLKSQPALTFSNFARGTLLSSLSWWEMGVAQGVLSQVRSG